jgi:hypothetical protein
MNPGSLYQKYRANTCGGPHVSPMILAEITICTFLFRYSLPFCAATAFI